MYNSLPEREKERERVRACETLASLRHVYLGSFFLDPEDIKSLSLGAIWNFSEGTGFPWTRIRFRGTKGPFL